MSVRPAVPTVSQDASSEMDLASRLLFFVVALAAVSFIIINHLFGFLFQITNIGTTRQKIMFRSFMSIVAVLALTCQVGTAFTPTTRSLTAGAKTAAGAATTLFMSDDDFIQETPEMTQERIQDLVDNHPVLLFMKGSKLFPQCGFSNTAVQILQAYDIDFQ